MVIQHSIFEWSKTKNVKQAYEAVVPFLSQFTMKIDAPTGRMNKMLNLMAFTNVILGKL